MEPIIGQLLESTGEVGIVLFSIWQTLKSLRAEISEVRDDVYKRLNNGIKDELTNLSKSIAHIEGQIEGLPRRKSDEYAEH